MLVLLWVVGALLIGLLAGGSFRGFSRVRLAGESVMLVLFAVQLVARGPFLASVGVRGVGSALWLVSTAALAVLALANVRRPGMLLIALGMVANLLVVAANGGMPVGERAVLLLGTDAARGAIADSGGFYFLASGNETLLRLADIVPLPAGRFSSVASLGDLLMFVGIAVFIIAVMTGRSDACGPNLALPPDAEGSR